MIKKISILLLAMVFLSMSVYAAGEKIQVSTLKEAYSAGDTINLRVSLYDSQNNPINDKVNIKIENAENNFAISKTIQSNELVDISLGEEAPALLWTITADYNGLTSPQTWFAIEPNELAKFEIKDKALIVCNIGNTQYSKSIQILIGEKPTTKQIDLGIGECTSFRLIAPDGNYNIKVTDGKTIINQGGVALTGNAIGILDNRQLSSSPLTSGVKGDSAPYGEDSLAPRNSSFVYIFLFIIFGAAILLAIERNFRKSAQRQIN